LRRFGFSYDWRREISTCIPNITSGTSGFSCACWKRIWLTARRAASTGVQNVAPFSLTAGRQRLLLAPRRHFVETREIEQWFLRTTAYAEQLLDDLKCWKVAGPSASSP